MKIECNLNSGALCNSTYNVNISRAYSMESAIKFMYFILDDGRVVYRECEVHEWNFDVVRGELFAVRAVHLDGVDEMNIVAVGLSSDNVIGSGGADIVGDFVRFEFDQPLLKSKSDSILLEIDTHLEWDGDVKLCAGENALVKVLLGVEPIGDGWQIGAGSLADDTIYRGKPNGAVDAVVSMVGSSKIKSMVYSIGGYFDLDRATNHDFDNTQSLSINRDFDNTRNMHINHDLDNNRSLFINHNFDNSQSMYIEKKSDSESIRFDAVLPTQDVFELILYKSGVAVASRVTKEQELSATVDAVETSDGLVAFENEPGTAMSVIINNGILSFFDELRYGLDINMIDHNLLDIMHENGATLVSDGSSNFLGVVGSKQIIVYNKLASGAICIWMYINNKGYSKVDIASDGTVFCYADDQFYIYFKKDNGTLTMTNVHLGGVSDFVVIESASEQYTLASVIDWDTVVSLYTKGASDFLHFNQFVGCSRVMKYSATTLYGDDIVGNTCWCMRDNTVNNNMAQAISNAVKNKYIVSNYTGMYLYGVGDGTGYAYQYNTVNQTDVSNLNMDNHRVWLCGCYVVSQDIKSGDFKVQLYDRANSTFVEICSAESFDKILDVGKLENYIVLLMQSGTLKVLQHNNTHGWWLKYDIKNTDSINGGTLVGRKNVFGGGSVSFVVG